IRRPFAEHKRALAGARVAQAADDHVAAPLLAIAHRDGPAGLPEVELPELAGSVDGALVVARGGQTERADLPQVVAQDGPAARVAELAEELVDAAGRHPRLGAKEAIDLLAVGLELALAWRAAIPRGRLGPKRPADSRAMTTRAPVDLRDGQALHEAHAADL